MRLLTIASLGVAFAALTAGAALAQVQYPPSSSDSYQSYRTPDYPASGYDSYGPGYSGQYAPPANNGHYQNPPVNSGYYNNGYSQNPPAYNRQSYQNYQNAMSAYDAARNTAARQGEDYDQNSADYMANQRAYRRQLREYNRAREAYDDEYGPGAYEAYYGPPLPPPY
ncbi:MAG: hypothetical protein ACREEB_03730 [Caulobacteraceae bacterium]